MRAVNLIPSEQRAGEGSLAGRSGGAALIVLGAIAGLAVLAVLYGGARRQIATEGGDVAKIEAQISEVRARTGRLTPYTAFVAMAEQRTKTVAQLVQARFDWSHELRELGRVLPKGSSLFTLTGTVGSSVGSASSASASSTPASSTPPGSTPSITLGGCSVSQFEVAQTLQRLKLMDGVANVHLQSSSLGSAASAGGAAGGSGCGNAYTFALTVTFAPLPSTPIPTVATTVPAAGPSASASHSEPVSARQARAGR